MTIKMRMHKLTADTNVTVAVKGSFEDMVHIMDLLTSTKCKIVNVNFKLKTFVIDNYHKNIDEMFASWDIIPDGEIYEDDYIIKWQYKAV